MNSEAVSISIFVVLSVLSAAIAHYRNVNYINASMAASLWSSVLTTASIAVMMICQGSTIAKYSYIAPIGIFAAICAFPVALIVGLPYIWLRKSKRALFVTSATRSNAASKRARAALLVTLAFLTTYLIVLDWQQMRVDELSEKLYVASKYGNIADVEHALRQGANVNYAPGYGTTPLMIASFYGKSESVRVLLSNGADPNRVAGKDDTALKWAVQNGHVDTANLLRGAGAHE